MTLSQLRGTNTFSVTLQLPDSHPVTIQGVTHTFSVTLQLSDLVTMSQSRGDLHLQCNIAVLRPSHPVTVKGNPNLQCNVTAVISGHPVTPTPSV